MQQKIRNLLNKETWETKTLGEIATDIYSGNEVTKSQLGTGDYPAVRYCEIHESNVCITKNKSFVNPDLIKNKKYCENGDFIITRVSENIEQAGKAVAYFGEKCILGAAILLIKHNQNPKFLAYMWQTKFIKQQIKTLIPKSTIMNFKTSYVNKIKIPAPFNNIQNLIVGFLDKFTQLVAELKEEWEKELWMRKKQYEYYKEILLTGGVDRWGIVRLSEIATDIYSGNEVTKSQLGTGSYPAVRYCEIHESNVCINENKSFVNPNLIKNKKYCENGDFVIVKVSENIEQAGKAIAYLGKKCILGSNTLLIKHHQNPKFLSYIWQTKFIKKQIQKLVKSSVIMYWNESQIKRIQIPLPSLKEQEEIVSKLDKFRKITEDFEEGIPKLLKLVEKQYEYYKEEIFKCCYK